MTVAVMREPTNAPMSKGASPETLRSMNLMKFSGKAL